MARFELNLLAEEVELVLLIVERHRIIVVAHVGVHVVATFLSFGLLALGLLAPLEVLLVGAAGLSVEIDDVANRVVVEAKLLLDVLVPHVVHEATVDDIYAVNVRDALVVLVDQGAPSFYHRLLYRSLLGPVVRLLLGLWQALLLLVVLLNVEIHI